jgi:hypothetical protein
MCYNPRIKNMGINPETARLIIYRGVHTNNRYLGYEGYGDNKPVDGGMHDLMSSDTLFVSTDVNSPYVENRWKYEMQFNKAYVGGASHFYTFDDIELGKFKFKTKQRKRLQSWLPKEVCNIKEGLIVEKEIEPRLREIPILKLQIPTLIEIYSGETRRLSIEELDR